MIDKQQAAGAVALIVMIMAITAVVVIADKISTNRAIEHIVAEQESNKEQRDSLFTFDPNTVTYQELLALGFEKHTAVSLLKYRARGKVFEIAEEFALCYGVTDSMFNALQPYIIIGEQFKAKPIKRDEPKVDTLKQLRRQRWEQKRAERVPHPYEKFRIDTVGIDYLQRVGFTYRQAEALIDYRDQGEEGIRNMAELADCWAVSPEMADSLARYVIFPEPKPYGGKVEINSADSTTLVGVRGIGPKTAGAIVMYRKLLGGFVSIDQLSELKCVTSENFARFSKEICCDSCVFSKIDINFAPASELEYHPYMTRKAINKIIQLRKSKGGWKSFEDIVSDDIFTEEQAAKLAPYLHFGEIPSNFQ
ncbi:MAG: helix-hairpin-helix domain-containing protein [Rikenellaceae bacterium]|nr:helix-hairpin-helix domain-containing protein [Rikenellaceae bacterium]